MKKILLIISTALVLANSVFAANEEHENHQAQDGQGMEPGMMMGVMNHEQMTQMHEHMQKMQSLMAEIKQEQNPEIRMQMMHEHMTNMDEGMQMMGGSRMGMSGSENMESMNMEERMSVMQNQMGMMNMMMEQMMNHFSQQQSHQE